MYSIIDYANSFEYRNQVDWNWYINKSVTSGGRYDTSINLLPRVGFANCVSVLLCKVAYWSECILSRICHADIIGIVSSTKKFCNEYCTTKYYHRILQNHTQVTILVVRAFSRWSFLFGCNETGNISKWKNILKKII